MVLAEEAGNETRKVIQPNLVKKISFDKRIVDDVTVRSINAFIMAYAFIFAISMLLVSFDCSSFEEVFTSVLTTMNNVGPAFGKPFNGFGFFSWTSKIVFIFDMLVGRLEIFPMLVLFLPSTWKKN